VALLERAQGFLWDKYRMLPQSVRFALLARERAPVWRQAGIVFVHVPKAAGTSINLALYGQTMGHARARDIRRWAPEDVNALPSFAVTRNPWDRLVSAYRFAVRGGGSGGAFEAGVWRPERFAIPEFETFERFVTEWLVRKHMWLDPIFQPQSTWICSRAGEILVDHVGRVEDLEPTIRFLGRTMGRVPQIAEGNRSGTRVDYRSFYTAALRRTVGEIYSKDVQAFAYEF
jgi:hypothetical protein